MYCTLRRLSDIGQYLCAVLFLCCFFVTIAFVVIVVYRVFMMFTICCYLPWDVVMQGSCWRRRMA